MKYASFHFLVAPFCIFFLLSCEPDEQMPEPEPVVIIPPLLDEVLTLSEVPLDAGNFYQYHIHRHIFNEEDTIKISLSQAPGSTSENKILFANIKFSESTGGEVDSGKFEITSSHISYQGFRYWYSAFADFKIEFPIEVDDEWVGDNPNDTYRVVSRSDSFPIFDLWYKNVFYIKRIFLDQELGINLVHTIQLKPGIGIIGQTIRFYRDGLTPQHETHRILNYHLN